LKWPHAELRTRRLRLAALLGAVLAWPGLAAAGAAQLEGVRMHEAPDYTRVVFDTSGPVAYDLFTLNDPTRVVIDLKDTGAAAGLDANAVAVDGVRVFDLRAAPRGRDYRLVLDVSASVEPKGFTLKPVPPYGHRLVVDLFARGPAASKPVAVKDLGDGRRDLLIAVDAGHGGEDPGAIGPDGIREKDVVLKLAKRLAAKLDATDGYRALLVRDGDYYIPLRKRVDIAREARADLFVSLHADAFKSPKVYGASVYTLSERGASSETARWLAEKENRSDLIGGAGDVPLEDVDDVLAGVLVDLAMDAKRFSSIQAGESLLSNLGGVTKLHKHQVEQAGFMVLKAPDVPSVLVETGYISNPAEARRLNTAAYQEALATALLNGIRNYMGVYAPPGTLIAWRRDQSGPGGGTRYTIERGDTLSAIAVRYGTSTRRIKEANGISGDRIRVGQVIVIPAG
jgi:N-acetylmuramoyl-L-alanine amidase